MAKSSADDEELRRACEAAIEGTKQSIVMSIRVAKSRGVWGKSGKLGRQMAKPRVLALSGDISYLLLLLLSFDSSDLITLPDSVLLQLLDLLRVVWLVLRIWIRCLLH